MAVCNNKKNTITTYISCLLKSALLTTDLLRGTAGNFSPLNLISFFFFFPFSEKNTSYQICASHPLLRLLIAVPGGDSVNSLKNVKAFYKSFGFSRRGRRGEGRGMI